ncbi:histidine kinase [Thermocoleostomius sinensis]|jgi:two-component system clock-associated histidine kinase SasA|uniref:Adaptive-response sensory-kinase SasA n=1 Tax=Thermocoleostomius sinensis A174 TaxID=2016057 RepID=A0A9E8ZC84_9CYAN|nr:histidine kinase [Thermocoleostomius sinensis]WAL60186.1 histidine kinase [Thermocoleostomius sinensis A174]
MEALPKQPVNPETPLQLLLFVDKRPSSGERIRQIRHCLKELAAEDVYELQVVDVSEQPHLAEHFKIVATPSLIKIHPEPHQTLAGSNLVAQLKIWWPRWQRSIEEYQSLIERGTVAEVASLNQIQSIAQSAEVIRLSDEIFRLQREREELQSQLQFKDQLIEMLAHDLRNPLTAVSIALETLEQLGHASKQEIVCSNPQLMGQLVRHARMQTKAIDRMITDVLQAARDKSAELHIQPKELELGHLCLEVIDRLREQFQAKFQQLKTDIPSDLPKVHADRERVRQVLINLLDNAIKYTPEHGTIEIAILHRTTQKVQVSICDTGPGIPLENQKSIFEERFRLKRDEAKEGYGIGLALCRRVIRAHYGQIWVDSEPNHGSCFHFTLPVYRSIRST